MSLDIIYGSPNILNPRLGGRKHTIRTVAGFNYFRYKEYLAHIDWHDYDVALIYLRNERFGLPKNIEEINLVNSVCLISHQSYLYADNEIVHIAGFGKKNETYSGAHLMTKMNATIAYGAQYRLIGFDPRKNFAYVNFQPPWQKTCSVGTA